MDAGAVFILFVAPVLILVLAVAGFVATGRTSR
jgi:hypothetical protein